MKLQWRDRLFSRILPLSIGLCSVSIPAFAADQPQWGHAWSRNMVSEEKGLPDSFDVKSGRNIKWSARLGTESYATPIIAGGRVYIGTNNENPRDPNHTADSGVLMCFEEATGKFLWQLVVPKREEDPYMDWPKTGWSSPVTVEGDRVYVVSSRGEVMCLDPLGMSNGNDGPYTNEAAHMIPRTTNAPSNPPPVGPQDGDILWLFDLTSGAGIWSHDGAHSSILIDGNYLYLNTGTGVDNTHKVIRTPNAPSIVVIDKRTGKLVARDYEHIAPNIFHSTWSSPSMGIVGGRPLIFFAGGNGVVYAFERFDGSVPVDGSPAKLRKVWQFDFDPTAPKGDIHVYLSNRVKGPSNIYGMPVFYDGRLYIAGGGDPFWGKTEAWLKCIDPSGNGDITASGLIWSHPLDRHVISTPAVYNDLVFIPDYGRNVHCLDARSGETIWDRPNEGEVWSSAYVADGKVFVGTRASQMCVFTADREGKLLAQIDMGAPISGVPTAANGVLFVSTMNRLYAIANSSK
ncbi:MAG TPA: PQQ-binding-like beta-propeller repeat protein [Verrucomicrobiae bacterium]